MKNLILSALIMVAASAPCHAESLQFYCHGNWDNGTEIFPSRYFVFILDTVEQTYIIEGLIEGRFTSSEQQFAALEKNSSSEVTKSFKLDRQSLAYEFSYYAEGLSTTVGSKGQCQLNPS